MQRWTCPQGSPNHPDVVSPDGVKYKAVTCPKCADLYNNGRDTLTNHIKWTMVLMRGTR